ncbi:MAG TPA: hypothetical protein VM533_20600 [Fimbriiglobus sp.]|jgi:hypothetical protein|nr:hypothetical protein [Fimbriiglobus sp.]
MIEKEWLTSADPVLLMRGLRDRISQRKCDLFELTCAERMSTDWLDPIFHEYLHFISRVVEGHNPKSDESVWATDPVGELAQSLWYGTQSLFAERTGLDQTVYDAVRRYVAVALLNGVHGELRWWDWLTDVRPVAVPTTPDEAADSILFGIFRDHLPLLRCIVGNPFRPVACDPSWRTSTAVGLADAIYSERSFDRLPILADALEEAGCTHPDVLAHCRGDGPHARGCWVVDLILGKS